MSLKDIDIGAALTRLAERKIEQAMAEGKFDRIEGMGKPLDLEPIPTEENARMRWWALKILRQNDVTPDEIHWRKLIDQIRDDLDRAQTESRVRELVQGHNMLVRRVNTLGTNALPTPVSPVALESELAKLEGRLATHRIAQQMQSQARADTASTNRSMTGTQAIRQRAATRSSFVRTRGVAAAAAARRNIAEDAGKSFKT